MKAYLFDYSTHELIGVTDADPSPAEPGEYLVPGNGTLIAAPTVAANEAAVFDPCALTWSVVPDFRGTTYWLSDGSEHAITALGVAVPAGASLTAVVVPPTAAQQWTDYQQQAKSALDATDTTMHRIAEGVALGLTSWTAADVAAWVNYRKALRAILSETQPSTIPTSLPTKPAYPAGT